MRCLTIVLALALLATSGCYTREQQGAATGAVIGGTVGHAVTRGSAVGTLLGALVGAAIGADIGRQLDEADRREAAYALEYVPTGVTHDWVNPDTGREYACRPVRTYEGSAGVPCRDFVILTSIDGQPAEIHGTACRDPDGTWRSAN